MNLRKHSLDATHFTFLVSISSKTIGKMCSTRALFSNSFSEIFTRD